VSDVRDLLARYVAQRRAMGEDLVILPPDAFPATGHPSVMVGETGQEGQRASARGSRLTAHDATRSAAGSDAPRSGWRRGAPPIPAPGIVVPPPARDLFTGDPLAGRTLDRLADLVRSCTRCRLCEARTHAVPGEGPETARLVVVGEGPGATEDETGRPFVGRAGELLTDILRAIELPREHVFICNIVKCRPPGNRKPMQDEIDACVPYLHRQLEIIRPAVILAMGGTAAETLLGTKQSLNALRNRVHEFRGVPLVVTYHPAALLRNPNWKKPTWDDVRIARQLLDQRR
jgi:DNA polymerase